VAEAASLNAGEDSAGLTVRDMMIALVMNLLWGLNLIAVKMAVDLVAPLTAGLMRQVIVLLVCLPWLRIVPGKMPALLALGVLSGGAFYIVTNLSLAVSSNIAALAIVGQLSVPISLILAVLVLGERIRTTRISGVLLAFGGVALLVFDPAIVDERAGILLTILASIIWAVCALIQRKLIGVSVLTIYAWIGCIGSLTLLPLAGLIEPESLKRIPDLPMSTIGWIVFSALGSTILGQGAMSILLQRHPVSTVTPLTLLTPVVAVMTSAAYFHKPLTPVMICGGILVMIGVAIVSIRTAKVQVAEIGR
jgi:O-acetylserine/cysteine efflux transporter